MSLIVAGVVLWAALHLLPALGSTLRHGIINKIGIGPYKGLFSLGLVAAIALMVLGWRSTPPQSLYVVDWLQPHTAYAIMYVGIFLFVAASFNTRIKRVIRHPQLTGFSIWAVTHLLLNGDTRAVALFGGLAFWALVQMLALNHRDGEWHKPPSPARSRELKPVMASLVFFAVLFAAHPWLSGGYRLPL